MQPCFALLPAHSTLRLSFAELFVQLSCSRQACALPLRVRPLLCALARCEVSDSFSYSLMAPCADGSSRAASSSPAELPGELQAHPLTVDDFRHLSRRVSRKVVHCSHFWLSVNEIRRALRAITKSIPVSASRQSRALTLKELDQIAERGAKPRFRFDPC